MMYCITAYRMIYRYKNYLKLKRNCINPRNKVQKPKKHAKMHEVLHSLASTDEAVNSQFIALEDSITVKIAERLESLGIKLENAMEKIHFAMDIIQSFSHEYVFDKHDYIDYFIMRDMVTKTVVSLFKY